MARQSAERHKLIGALDRPWIPGAVLLGASGLFVVVRLVVVGHGNPGAFVVAGTGFANSHQVPHGLPVVTGAGYDGQFYYRLALNPLQLGPHYRGITLDGVIRLNRIGYPILVWLASFGHAAAVPAAAILVNLAALFALGTLCALWARTYGRHAAWGLLPAGYFGLVWSLARDLTEITAAAFLVAGILMIKKGRFVIAGLLLGAGVLCRETVLVLVAAVGLGILWDWYRTRRLDGRPLAAVAIPVAVVVGWQAYVAAAWGSLPLRGYSGTSGAPFLAMVRAVHGWLAHPDNAGQHQLLQFLVLAVFVVIAVSRLRSSQAALFEKIAFVLYLILALCLSGKIWNDDPMEFRTFSELFILSAGIVMSSRRRLVLPWWVGSAALALVWVVAAGVRARSV